MTMSKRVIAKTFSMVKECEKSSFMSKLGYKSKMIMRIFANIQNTRILPHEC